MVGGRALLQIRGVSNTIDIISDTNRSRLRVGQLFTPRELQTLGSTNVPVHTDLPFDVVPDQWSVDEVLALAEGVRAR